MNRWEIWVCPKHGVCRDDGDFIEGQDPNLANANDPDGWTGILYCGYSHDSEGCYQEVEQIEVMPVAHHERLMADRCACHVRCGDVPEEVDDSGVCKGLPR